MYINYKCGKCGRVIVAERVVTDSDATRGFIGNVLALRSGTPPQESPLPVPDWIDKTVVQPCGSRGEFGPHLGVFRIMEFEPESGEKV